MPLWNLLTLLVTLTTSHIVPSLPSSIPTVATEPPATVATAENSGFDAAHAPFEVRFADEIVPYRVFAEYVLPGDEVSIQTSADTAAELVATAGTAEPAGPGRWQWRAPAEPGVYPIEIGAPGSADRVVVNAVVMVPYDAMRGGRLDGYTIGNYPERWVRGGRAYSRPRGFIQLTAATDSILVAPHFRLGQFACKAGSGYPKYLVLQPDLLDKLERLLATANERGVSASTFHVMSAYRTPLYNKSIGNPTTFSRHQYGDAADIFVDESPVDGRMDDLDHDGRPDRGDARVLGTLVEEMDRSSAEALVGGLGTYDSTPTHGPFVHVDARGYAARW